MASFRIADQARTFFGQTGQLLAGGSLVFTTAGTTTPVNVYGNLALTTNNGSTVALDSAGRPAVDVWGDTAILYRMRVYDSLSVLQADIDNIEVAGGAGQTIPVPDSGEFVTGDGVNFLVATIREVPDPTGNANKIVGTDGTNITWVAKPADGTAGAAGVSDTASTATSLRVGTVLIQWGTATAAATGTDFATANITFPVAFGAAPYFVAPTVTVATVNGTSLVADSFTSASTTGCTINFNNADRHFDGSSKLTAAIPFTYMAIGLKP